MLHQLQRGTDHKLHEIMHGRSCCHIHADLMFNAESQQLQNTSGNISTGLLEPKEAAKD